MSLPAAPTPDSPLPTQTAQETIDALEYVRQLFEANCVQSVQWHRFALTESSPIAAQPGRFGVRVLPAPRNAFSNYVLKYEEPCAADHDQFREGLHKTATLYMAGLGLDRPVQSWFSNDVPGTTLAPDFVGRYLEPRMANEMPGPGPHSSAPEIPETTFPLRLTLKR